MKRRGRSLVCALMALGLSACVDDSPEGALCPPACPPIMPGVGDAAVTQPNGPQTGASDAATPNPALDAGRPPLSTFDASVTVAVDAGTPWIDAAPSSNPDAGSASDAGALADAGAEAGSLQTLPPVTDYSKLGPFKTTMQANVGPNDNYTVFRPDPLGANGFLHAPIIFGPGILTSASTYRALLTQFASHGFVVICVNSMFGGPGAANNLSDMTMGLDWLIAQNTASGVYQGKLAVDRAVAMGYSIGASASVQLASHKAVMTSVIIHGHNVKGDPHGPVLMITGTSDVIDDMRKTLATLEEAPAVLVALPIGHIDVLGEIGAGGRYTTAITAWLRYWVNGDQAAKRYFWGSDCEMCKSPWITPEPNAKWKAQML